MNAGLQLCRKKNRPDPFAEGMEKIYKQLMTTLEEIGVKPIEAVGNEFNPDFHNAVMHVEDEELGENIIAEEFQKGYTYQRQCSETQYGKSSKLTSTFKNQKIIIEGGNVLWAK